VAEPSAPLGAPASPALPEGNDACTVMNEPLNQALRGEISTRQAMQESQRQLNELFARRPPEWRS
jgi:hypothetical protein